MKTIEDQIREKKAEIKEANRALSKLQDEAKRKNEPLIIDVTDMESGDDLNKDGMLGHRVTFYANRKLDFFKVRSAIESLSETSEPKSYVNWKDERLDGFNWIGRNSLGDFYMAQERMYHNSDGILTNDAGLIRGFCPLPSGMISELPHWTKSLIHRPGAKE